MEKFLSIKTPQWRHGGVLKEQASLMEDMGSYFRKWRECTNGDLGSKSSTSIKGAEKDDTSNQPINQQIDKSTTQSTQCQGISTNPSFSTSFQQIQAFQQAFSNLSNFSTIFPGFSQVSGKFPTVLFHSLVVKFSIFSDNFSILITNFIQVCQVFKHNTIFIVKSNDYFNNFSILVAIILQIYQLSTSCYFIPS